MKNAILMASGLGTRMKPLTESVPKPLIKVIDKPMIETIIDALLQHEIENIFIVVGYLKEQFEYLKQKYKNITLIENPDYLTVNNISSIYYARNVLRQGDCYICEADLYVSNPDVLKVDIENSCYFGKMVKGYSEDWVFDLDNQGYISRVGKYGTDCFNMTGIAYFDANDASILADVIEDAYCSYGYEKLFWDDVVNNNLDRLKLKVHPIDVSDIIEIDTVNELEEVRKILCRS